MLLEAYITGSFLTALPRQRNVPVGVLCVMRPPHAMTIYEACAV